MVLVPAEVVTVTSTTAADSGGDVAEIEDDEFTVNDVAGVEPKATAVAPLRSVPVMVTAVPPLVGPESGLTPVTAGGTTV